MDFNKITKKKLFTIIELLMAKVDSLTARVAELEEENRLLNLRKLAPIARWLHLLIYSKQNLTRVSGLKVDVKEEVRMVTPK